MTGAVATLPRPTARARVPQVGTGGLVRLSTATGWAVWIALSAALGVVMSQSAAVATLHMGVVLLAVIALGVFSPRPAPILALTLYAGVCDVLWRSNSARGPYEAGKYAVIFGCACLAIRFVRRPRHLGPATALVLFLVPGAVVTAMNLPLSFAREVVLANLAGLVALAFAVIACASLRVDDAERRGLYGVVLGPIVALTASATFGTLTAGTLDWTNEVNFSTSAGFGPNQVSSVIALGALLCALVVLRPGTPLTLRLVALATAIWMVGQMVLTFSRGGVFGLVVALAVVGLLSLFRSGQRTRTIVAAALLMFVGIQIMAWAGAFTGGASEERFSSTDATNRLDIAAADVDLFLERPILGVGAGMARYERDLAPTAAHTEYTRLLAEHGLLGIGVLVILGVLIVRIVRAGVGWDRLAAAALVTLALSQMLHSATRIASIAVAFGLAALLTDHPEAPAVAGASDGSTRPRVG